MFIYKSPCLTFYLSLTPFFFLEVVQFCEREGQEQCNGNQFLTEGLSHSPQKGIVYCGGRSQFKSLEQITKLTLTFSVTIKLNNGLLRAYLISFIL